jgi:hypothetical protein
LGSHKPRTRKAQIRVSQLLSYKITFFTRDRFIISKMVIIICNWV